MWRQYVSPAASHRRRHRLRRGRGRDGEQHRCAVVTENRDFFWLEKRGTNSKKLS